MDVLLWVLWISLCFAGGFLVGGLMPVRRAAPLAAKELKCAQSYCGAVRDPRCKGLQCTYHCHLWCSGRCEKAKPWDAEELERIARG